MTNNVFNRCDVYILLIVSFNVCKQTISAELTGGGGCSGSKAAFSDSFSVMMAKGREGQQQLNKLHLKSSQDQEQQN